MHRLSSVLPSLGLEAAAPTPDRSRREDGLPRWVVWTPAPGVRITARVIDSHAAAARVEWAEPVLDGGFRRLEYRRRWVQLRELAPWQGAPM